MSNLGSALQALGERRGEMSDLEEAVAAFHAALTEFTPERVPMQWAMTQNNLGKAPATLGEREDGTARLEEAREAIRLASDVYREAGMGQYDAWLQTRLRSIDVLIATRLSK